MNYGMRDLNMDDQAKLYYKNREINENSNNINNNFDSNFNSNYFNNNNNISKKFKVINQSNKNDILPQNTTGFKIHKDYESENNIIKNDILSCKEVNPEEKDFLYNIPSTNNSNYRKEGNYFLTFFKIF